MQKQRNNLIDALKGIGILWILLGHAVSYFESAGYIPARDFLINCNRLLNVPVNMFLTSSGFFFMKRLYSSEFNISLCAKSRHIRIYLPSMIVLVVCLAYFELLVTRHQMNIIRILTRNSYELLSVIWGYILPFSNYIAHPKRIPYLSHLWFSHALFQMSLAACLYIWLIRNIVGSEKGREIITLLIFSIAVALIAFYNISNPFYWGGNSQMTHLSIDAFLFGGLVRIAKERTTDWNIHPLWATGMLIVIMLTIVLLIFRVPYSIDKIVIISSCSYAVIGIMLFICTKVTFPATANSALSWLSYIGRHSYGIYLTHYPLVMLFIFIPNIKQQATIMIILFLIASSAFGIFAEKIASAFWISLAKTK